MNAMKKLVYSLLVLCSAGLLAWACNSMDESVAVTDLEESFNLKAPNGTLLAKSAAALKVFISDGFDISDAEFEITNIDYKKAIRGYLAEITCLLPNGEVKPVLITDWVLDSDGKLVPPTIERIKTKATESYAIIDGRLCGCAPINGRCRICSFTATVNYEHYITSYICQCTAELYGSCKLTVYN